MSVTNAASALGEAIGKIIENVIKDSLTPVCGKLGYYYDSGGIRPGIRTKKKLELLNKSGNVFQLDGVIETTDRKPVILLESKYLRYTKHNRDKASWTCAAHYNLRKCHPTIRKSIAVLSGNWSETSKKLMESFGIELYEIEFEHLCNVLDAYGVNFRWSEKDRVIPKASWARFESLSDRDKTEMGVALLEPVINDLILCIELSLRSGETWAKRLSEIELLLKTDRNEYHTYTFPSVQDALVFMIRLQEESKDLSGKLE